MKNLFLILAIFLVATVSVATAQSYKVIVNEANATGTISSSELSDIFLKKKSNWDDGTAINPVDQSARSGTREEFSQQVHGRGVGAIRNFWQQAAFSGRGTAPPERSSDAEVIDFVKANSGAIGYISAATDDSEVKVLTIN